MNVKKHESLMYLCCTVIRGLNKKKQYYQHINISIISEEVSSWPLIMSLQCLTPVKDDHLLGIEFCLYRHVACSVQNVAVMVASLKTSSLTRTLASVSVVFKEAVMSRAHCCFLFFHEPYPPILFCVCHHVISFSMTKEG